MKFKTDENLPEELAAVLRNSGWDCRSVIEQQLGGQDDTRITRVCEAEQRILVTFDRGFSNVNTASRFAAGVIVLRLRSQDKRHVLTVAERLVKALSERELRNELWIVHETRIRVRRIEGRGRPANKR